MDGPLPDRDALDPPHAILIGVNCVENIGVFLKALLLFQLEEVLFPGYSAVAKIQHTARFVDIKPAK